MKKIVCAFMAVSILAVASAFSAEAKSGIEAGYVNSSYSFKSGISGDNNYSLNGFYVGLSQDVPLFAGLHIVPGIYYTFLTDNSREDVMNFKLKGSLSDHYLNVPIMFRYQFGLPGVKLFIFAGPTLSLGLVSNQKYTISGTVLDANIMGDISYNYYTGKVNSKDLDIPQDTENPYKDIIPDIRYNRFDVLLGGGIGIEAFKFLEVKVGYDWGLLNRYKGDGAELHRNQVYAGIGIRF